LANGDCAVSILNLNSNPKTCELNFQEIGLPDKYEIRDLWEHTVIGKSKKGQVLSHETKVFRLKKA
jgi:hypothetical protein